MRTSTGKRFAVAAALVGTLITGCSGGSSTGSRSGPLLPTIPRSIFGLNAACIGIGEPATCAGHDQWPLVPFGAYRILWEPGTTWAGVEPSPGRFNFTFLDARVNAALDHGADVLLELGVTPTWAASNLNVGQFRRNPGAYSPPRDPTSWQRYVAAVAAHFRGRIHAYEIWDEPNIYSYWHGTPVQMAQLTQLAYRAIKTADPSALVLSPGVDARDLGAARWLSAYLAAGAGPYFDALAVHLYPPNGKAPEDAVALLAPLQRVLATYRVAGKPIWDTEIGYGFYGPDVTHPYLYTGATAVGAVARTFLLALASGVQRTYWFTTDQPNRVGLNVVTASETSLTEGGVALREIYHWIAGAVSGGCSIRSGPSSCQFGYPNNTGIVFWSTTAATRIAAPARSVCLRTLDGRVQPLHPGQAVTIGPVPVLVVTSQTPAGRVPTTPGTLTAGDPCS